MSTITQPPASLLLCPFTIIVDTREQAPFTFHAMPVSKADRKAGRRLIVKTVSQGLPTGDYSLVDYENDICVERKSIGDLYGTLGGGRERFEREFNRMMEMEFAAVVIEAGWAEICRPVEFNPGWHSKLDPRSVFGTIFSWSIRYSKVHWYVMGGRRMAEIATFELLSRFWREKREEKLEAKRVAKRAAKELAEKQKQLQI